MFYSGQVLYQSLCISCLVCILKILLMFSLGQVLYQSLCIACLVCILKIMFSLGQALYQSLCISCLVCILKIIPIFSTGQALYQSHCLSTSCSATSASPRWLASRSWSSSSRSTRSCRPGWENISLQTWRPKTRGSGYLEDYIIKMLI